VQGAEDIVLDAIGAAEPWGYRNHVQLSVDPQGRLGYLTADTHRVVPVDDCLIADPLLEDLWAALDMEWPQLHRLSLRCGSATGDLMAVFELDHYEDFDIHVDFAVSCVILLADGEAVVLMGDSVLIDSVAGHDFHISAGSFFQVNTAGAEALVSLVPGYLDPQGHETLVDLYCGVGLFGLVMADSVGRVIGVESSASAAADFQRNARGRANVELLEGKAKDAMARIQEPVDLLVLDPPRSGAGAPTVGEIARLGPSRIVYVSCDPATFSRDSRRFAEQGYGLRLVQPLDLFPQTFHVESVAVFEKD
jgi:23S rRNA (uracil1939-C5)-methyltransferase